MMLQRKWVIFRAAADALFRIIPFPFLIALIPDRPPIVWRCSADPVKGYELEEFQ